jgi:hypothetical protein
VRSRLVLLGGQTIALGLMMAFLVVPVSALFLDAYGAAALPYAYIAVAAAGVVVSAAMTRAQARLSLAGLATAVLAGYVLLAAAGWVVLVSTEGRWVTFPLLVMFPLSIPIGFVLVGSQAGRLLDVRQMKAHFPRIAAGFSVGFAVGGLSAAAVVPVLGGPENLLVLDVVAALAMLGLVLETARRHPAELRAAPAPRATARPDLPSATGVRELLTHRLVVLIFAYQVLSAAVTQLLDYMVWERAAVRYPDPSDLAQFQGFFGAVINVVSVVFVVALAGWLLTRFGIGLGLVVNPLGVLVVLAVTTALGYSVGPLATVFFVFVCAQQVTDISLTDGTTRASINATYQALSPDLRLRAQTLIEGAGVPLALGFVGLLLIAHTALGLDVRAVAVMTLVLAVAWAGAAVRAYREYGADLRAVLSRRSWESLALRIDDDASRAAVDQLLSSADPRDVHAALDALVDTGDPAVDGHVVTLLRDPDPKRRRLGVEVALASGRLDTAVVSAAATVLLDDPDDRVRTLAAAALVRRPKGEREAARSAWLRAASSSDPGTVRSALAAAADAPHRFFVPYLVGLAASETASGALLDALTAHADHLLPGVAGLLSDPSVPRRTRERMVFVLGRSAAPEARDVLVAHLDDGDLAIVEAAATCLVGQGYHEPSGQPALDRRLTEAVVRIGRCLDVLALLDGGPGSEELADALRDEISASARRVSVLLGLVHDPRAIRSGLDHLSADDRERGTALEMLEVTLGRSALAHVLTVADPALDDAERRTRCAAVAAGPDRDLVSWLEELVRDPDAYWHEPWLRACALRALPGRMEPAVAAGLAAPWRDDDDPTVAQTARWVGWVVDGGGSGADVPARQTTS